MPETVASLYAADRLAPVIVVAHNCSDATDELAAQAGAQVLELKDVALGGKGAALREGFSAAIAMGANAPAGGRCRLCGEHESDRGYPCGLGSRRRSYSVPV